MHTKFWSGTIAGTSGALVMLVVCAVAFVLYVAPALAVVSIPPVVADDNAKPKDSVPGAEDKAEQILSASHDYVATHSVEIQQTVEQTASVLVDGQPLGPSQATKQTSSIEIDADKG